MIWDNSKFVISDSGLTKRLYDKLKNDSDFYETFNLVSNKKEKPNIRFHLPLNYEHKEFANEFINDVIKLKLKRRLSKAWWKDMYNNVQIIVIMLLGFSRYENEVFLLACIKMPILGIRI